MAQLWQGSVEVLPGLRLIPDSRIREVADAQHDVTIIWSDGECQRATIITRFDTNALTCFDATRLTQRIQVAVSKVSSDRTVVGLYPFGRWRHFLTACSLAALITEHPLFITPESQRAPWSKPFCEVGSCLT